MLNYSKRITSEAVKDLQHNEIFCFGSNLSGAHGAGAARYAKLKFRAEEGVGFGPTGRTYAIPTKDQDIQTMTIEQIRPFVDLFIVEAGQDKEHTYLVTAIGTGLAGIPTEEIAPLFREAIKYENIHLPISFWDILTK